MSDHIDISGLPKTAVLAALYNGAAPAGLGFLWTDDAPSTMTAELAERVVAGSADLYFEYVFGRLLHVDLDTDQLDPSFYDHDQGQGAAAQAIEQLRRTGETTSDAADARRRESTQLRAHEAMTIANTPSGPRDDVDGIPVLEIGGAHIGEALQKAVDREVERTTKEDS